MHKHTCLNCGCVLEEGDFDCEFDSDHDWALCDNRCGRDEMQDEMQLVVGATRNNKIGCICPVHGFIEGAERKQQDPAPCGCAWVWNEEGLLEAVPSSKWISEINL